MKKCSDGCPAVCDFCIYFKFNRKDPNEGGCKLHRKKMIPYHDCNCFFCKIRMKEIKEMYPCMDIIKKENKNESCYG